jgi:hypothetical protein
MKGAKPIHVYADLNRTADITSNCTFINNKIIVYNVPSNGTIYVTIHLDFALKGTEWTEDQIEAWYSEHTFQTMVDYMIYPISASTTSTTTITGEPK